MHDTNLLQLITDDFAPAQRLLALLQTESLALHGRDMPLLEEILAEKQALIILLEQHGRKRSEILASLNLPSLAPALSNSPAIRALAVSCWNKAMC